MMSSRETLQAEVMASHDRASSSERKASAPAGTGNIPALLLQAIVTTGGSDGDRLSGTTWVQRLNTSGGVAPAGACTPGDTIAVPYTADYVFWKGTAASEDESDD